MKCTAVNGRRRLWANRLEPSRMYVVLFALVFYAASFVRAQEPTPDQSPVTAAQDNSQSAPRHGSFVIAPIPIASPAVGNGVTIVGAYIFPLRKSDTVSPPSLVGGAWVGTDNGTRAWVAASELFFNQNRYHVVAGVSHADLNYDFYGTGTAEGDAGLKFGLNQSGNVFFSEVLRRTFWELFIGPRIWFGTSKLEPRHFGENHPGLPPLDVDLDMRSLGLKIERDTRPNRFYPQKGSQLEIGSDFFAKDLGGTYTFQRYRFIWNYYRSFGEKQVLAYNLFGCSTGGQAPFFGQCIFGMQDELRGYPAGRYIDMKMLATQVEYRRVLPWRFGVAAFGGIGEVAPTWSKFNAENILPSGGVGPRFMLSRKYHVNLRADFAWGKNGNTFSMGLGESY